MKKVLVYGDIIVDRYSKYRYKKQCPDQIMTSAYTLESQVDLPGGAANVACNLAELLSGEGIVYLVGSSDRETDSLIRTKSNYKIRIETDDQKSIVKERIFLFQVLPDKFRLDENSLKDYQIRLDSIYRYQEHVAYRCENIAIELLSKYTFDAIVISDYGSGLFRHEFLSIIKNLNIPVFLDTKEKDLKKLENPFVLKLNRDEYEGIGMIDNRFAESYCQNCIVTLGKDGAKWITVEEDSGSHYKTNTIHFPIKRKVDVADVTGCGDTFLAGLVYKYLNTNDIVSSIEFANLCASTVVQDEGTSCVVKSEIQELDNEVR